MSQNDQVCDSFVDVDTHTMPSNDPAHSLDALVYMLAADRDIQSCPESHWQFLAVQ